MKRNLIFLIILILFISCSVKHYHPDMKPDASFISDGIFQAKMDGKEFTGIMIIKKLGDDYFLEAKLNSIIPFTIAAVEVSKERVLFVNYYEKKYWINEGEWSNAREIYDLLESAFFYYEKSKYHNISIFNELRKGISTDFGMIDIVYDKKDDFYLLKEARLENEKSFLVYKQSSIRSIQEKDEDMNFHLKIPDNFDILE